MWGTHSHTLVRSDRPILENSPFHLHLIQSFTVVVCVIKEHIIFCYWGNIRLIKLHTHANISLNWITSDPLTCRESDCQKIEMWHFLAANVVSLDVTNMSKWYPRYLVIVFLQCWRNCSVTEWLSEWSKQIQQRLKRPAGHLNWYSCGKLVECHLNKV